MGSIDASPSCHASFRFDLIRSVVLVRTLYHDATLLYRTVVFGAQIL